MFPQLAEFRTRLKLNSDAVFVPVLPRPDSVPDNCTEDVERQVPECGGEAVLGWMIWAWPGIMAEAVFHSIWRSPDGTLLDVNRKADGEDRVLFFFDPKLTYTNERIPTVRVALRDHPLVQEFVHIADEFDAEFAAQYGRYFLGDVTLRGRLLELGQRKNELEAGLLCLVM
jgi:hypothetical protein